MIKHSPPSIVGPYDLISTYDPSLAWPVPPELDPGESDADYEARLKRDFVPRRDEFARLLLTARETGRFESLIKDGEQPTRFRVRQMPPSVWVQWDRVVAKLSPLERAALAIRCVILGAEGWTAGFTVGNAVEHLDLDGHPSGLGRVAPFDVIASFYSVKSGNDADELIVDIGGQILHRRGSASGN